MKAWHVIALVTAWWCTACQPSSQTAAEHASKTQTSAAHTSSAVHSSKTPTRCDNIPLQMSAITANSDLQSLAIVNQALKRCAPLVDDETRLQWLEASWPMYQRFLHTNADKQLQDVWDEFSGTLEGYPTESSDDRQARLQRMAQLWPKLPARMQHLSTWLGKEYIDNIYTDDGKMRLRRHPRYLIDIFAPVLPEAEKQFVLELGKENTHLTINDDTLVIPWSEVARRVLFWESYLERYPDSRYFNQAQYLFAWYQALLYIGLDNTPLIDDVEGRPHINLAALQTHQQLMTQHASKLAEQSAALMKWYQELESSKQAVPVNEARQQWQKIRKSMQINFPKPLSASKNGVYDCFTDALCQIVQKR